jgi:ubiquinone/menaquinone biosynthesis C-methylase UbiE
MEEMVTAISEQEGNSVTADERAEQGNTLLGDMHRTVLRFSAIRALVAIGVPEQLRDGPVSVDDLAARCDAHAPTLTRLLRTTATTGLLRTVAPGTYELTDEGRALIEGTELQRLRHIGNPEMWVSLGELPQTARTGRAPFLDRYGSAYNYLSAQPHGSAVFDALMVSLYKAVAPRLAEVDIFPETGTVADIGGGKGTFLAAILKARPGLHGILLDMKRSVDVAREYLTEQGVADRAEVVAGDFFAAVPPGADVYLLAHIIHNWSDEESVNILRVVRSAIPAGGRLLVEDMVLPDDDRPHYAKDLDIRMLSAFDGRERSEAEFTRLLASAGFRVDGIVELGASAESAIIASPVPEA